jgi:hypothetical protein
MPTLAARRAPGRAEADAGDLPASVAVPSRARSAARRRSPYAGELPRPPHLGVGLLCRWEERRGEDVVGPAQRAFAG